MSVKEGNEITRLMEDERIKRENGEESMHNSTYFKLNEYLAHNQQQSITLSFQQIEEILGFELPRYAYIHPAWWSNEDKGNHAQAKTWLDAGYSTEDVRLRDKITFRRMK